MNYRRASYCNCGFRMFSSWVLISRAVLGTRWETLNNFGLRKYLNLLKRILPWFSTPSSAWNFKWAKTYSKVPRIFIWFHKNVLDTSEAYQRISNSLQNHMGKTNSVNLERSMSFLPTTGFTGANWDVLRATTVLYQRCFFKYTEIVGSFTFVCLQIRLSFILTEPLKTEPLIRYFSTNVWKQLWALQFSLSVIHFYNLSSKPRDFHTSEVWTKWLVKTSRLFLKVRIILCWRFDYVIRGWLTEKMKDHQGFLLGEPKWKLSVFNIVLFVDKALKFFTFLSIWSYYTKQSVFQPEMVQM